MKLLEIDAGEVDQPRLARPARLDEVTRRQDDTSRNADHVGSIGMLDGRLSYQARASGKVILPRPEDDEIPGGVRDAGATRVLNDLRLLIESGQDARFNQPIVPQVAFAQDAVQQLSRRRFHLAANFPEPQHVAVAHFFPGHVDAADAVTAAAAPVARRHPSA